MKQISSFRKLLVNIIMIILPVSLLSGQTMSNVYYGESDKQVLDYWKAPAPNSPVLIFIHGGDEWADKSGPLIQVGPEYFSKLGYATVNINYRHPGNSGYPQQKGWPMPLRDLACAVAFVKRNAGIMNGDPDRVILIGYSAGGFLANMHGHTFNDDIRGTECLHKGDISVLAVVSIASWRIGMTRRDLPAFDEVPFEQMEIINFVNNKTNPAFLILHGTDDRKVGSFDQFIYYRLLKERDYSVRMRIINGKGHAILFNHPEICNHIALFLDDLLKHKKLSSDRFIDDVKMVYDRAGRKVIIDLPERVREDIVVRFFGNNKMQVGTNVLFNGAKKHVEILLPEILSPAVNFYVSAFSEHVCQTLEVKPGMAEASSSL